MSELAYQTSEDIDPFTVKPLGSKVLVKQNPKESSVSTGLIIKHRLIDKDSRELELTFTVINVGSKVKSVKRGDIVSLEWMKQFKFAPEKDDGYIKEYEKVANKQLKLIKSEDPYFIFDEKDLDVIWNEIPKFLE